MDYAGVPSQGYVVLHDNRIAEVDKMKPQWGFNCFQD
jgi:hypothetical protein